MSYETSWSGLMKALKDIVAGIGTLGGGGATVTKTQGDTAAGATDTGFPVKVGGVYRATPPTLLDGQRGDLILSQRNLLLIDSVDFISATGTVNAADVGSSAATGQNNQSIITGTPTANSTFSLAGSGNSTFAVLVTGTWVGTLQFERSLDNGVTWTSVGASSAGTRFNGQTITANGAFHGNASSSTNIRMRATAWTSGTASIKILLGQGTGTITIGNPVTTLPLFTQFAAEPQLTAPGSTQALDVTAFPRVHCQYVIASINTNVVVRLEGSNDGTNWSNLAQGEVDTTRTTNGVFSFITTAPLFRVRFTFVSESGGTAATIDVRFTAN